MGSMADAARYGLAWWRRLMFAAVGRAPRLSAPALGFMLGRVAHALERRLPVPGEAAAELYQGAARGAQVEAVAEYIRRAAPADLRADISDHIAATRATRAVIADMAAVVRPWPFRLAGVTTPVELWHGTDDPAVPLGYAQGLAADLGNACVHPCAGEGHFVFHTHGGQVVASIRNHAGRTAPQTRS
jgi:pimeloyl-ACP methyl ester carboxylesterase